MSIKRNREDNSESIFRSKTNIKRIKLEDIKNISYNTIDDKFFISLAQYFLNSSK
jgi:hypothetical protein